MAGHSWPGVRRRDTAPFGAYLTKKIPTKPMMIAVGCLIIGLSLRTIIQSWF
jgi:hypothetical protein